MKDKFAMFAAANAAREKAEYVERAAFVAAFPVGAPVEWMHGHYRQRGVVNAISYGIGSTLGLFAVNEKTGRRVSISYFDILQAAREQQ